MIEQRLSQAAGSLRTTAKALSRPTVPVLGHRGSRQFWETGLARKFPFEFHALASGPYELSPRWQEIRAATFSPKPLSRKSCWSETPPGGFLLPIRETLFDFTALLTDPKAAQVWAQRVDPAEKSPPVVLPLTNSRAMLYPGRRELRLSPPAGILLCFRFFRPAPGSGQPSS